MTREQYEFSNVFWEDPNWTDKIPKYYDSIDVSVDPYEGSINFYYLNNEEMKEFIKIKSKENPEVMKDIRYKKLMRVLKINK